MSTTDDPDGERTRPQAGAAPARPADDFTVTGLIAERQRGRASGEAQAGHILPLGTRLRDYEITGLVGEGGFGIVYLAWDHSLQRRVAIKEYMPSSMATRVGGSSAIIVKSERHLDTFKAGLKSFVNEARLLARFDHPSLVKVYRFWEENGTAYMVMPYYEGPTLKTALAALGHVPNESEIRAWLKPILNALALMHAAQCYHRDIAPDNILLTPRGPLLLDFGAARRVIGDMTHAMTVVLKPGYAPIEQYGDVTSMAQGPWTDLYALGCVVYFAITGKTPTSSVERLMDDRLEPLSTTAAGRYSPAFLRAVDAALAVRPADRPQDHRQFRALLDADLPPAFAATTSAMPLDEAPPSLWPELGDLARPGAAKASTPPLQTLILERPPAAGAAASSTSPERRPRAPRAAGGSTPRRSNLIALAIGVVAAAALVWWFVHEIAPRSAARSASTAASAPVAVAPTSSAAVATTPSSPAASAPIEVEVENLAAPTVTRRAPRSHADVVAIASAPVAATAVANPTPTASSAPRVHREPPATPRSEPAEAVKAPAPRAAVVSSKCSDILQKASLEPLTADESAYLKRECR